MQSSQEISPAIGSRNLYRSIMSWVIFLVFPCMAEFPVIHTYWFGTNESFDTWKAAVLPFFFMVSAIIGNLFWLGINQKQDQISPPTYSWLKQSFEMVFMLTYMVITFLTSEIVKISPH